MSCFCKFHETEKVLKDGRTGVRIDEFKECYKILHFSRFNNSLLLLWRELLLFIIALSNISFLILLIEVDC